LATSPTCSADRFAATSARADPCGARLGTRPRGPHL